MNITAIVPARGGSTRLPNKNLRKLNDRPLIFYTIDAFMGHDEIDRIVFTSDSVEYCDKVFQEYGEAVTIEHRPSQFAQNTTKVVEELNRLLTTRKDLFKSDWFMMGLPTAPLRDKGDVRKLLDYHRSHKKGCFSCSEYDFPIQFGFSLMEDGTGASAPENWVAAFGSNSPMISGNTRSQDIAKMYRPNGAIYLSNRDVFLKTGSLYSNCHAIDIGQIAGTDIDTELDFLIADSIIKNGIKYEK